MQNSTLVRGLHVLEAMARCGEVVGPSEVARLCALPKSAAHRVLQTLATEGYVHRTEGGAYKVGTKLCGLGSTALQALDLRQLAEPAMDSLLRLTGCTVHLAVLDGDEVLYIHKLEGSNDVRGYTHIGGRALAHCVATGKAMLAFKGKDYLSRLSTRLRRSSPNTVVDPGDFLGVMRTVASDGFAVNFGELREGVNGVASPVFDGLGLVVAAIGISAPERALPRQRVDAVSPLIAAAALELSGQLCGDGAKATLQSAIGSWHRSSASHEPH